MRDAESDVGAALRRDGRAAAYEGTGVGVRGRARRRRAVEARGGRFRCFWRCPHGRRLGKATPGLVRLGMQQRASSSGPFSCVANVVALRLRCRDMPSCPVFREPVLRRRGASLPERRVWRTLPSLSNLRSSGVGPATAASEHLKLAAAAPISFVSVALRFSIGHRVGPQGGPHGPLSPLAGEDAAPEAALVVLSLTKFDVSHLSADNSVQHVPPHRIWEEPSLSRGLGLVLAGSADAHVAREPHRWRIATLPRPWTVAGAKTAHGCARELPKASIACSSSQRARRAN